LKDFQRARAAAYINAKPTLKQRWPPPFLVYLEDGGLVTLRNVLQRTHVAFDVAGGVMDSA
jgi:hypothetical protein